MLLEDKLNQPDFVFNSSFSFKYIFTYGVLFGGHNSLMDLTTISAAYGVRTQNLIINLTKTALELTKLLLILTGLGFGRGIIYFINSILSFSIPFKNSFRKYNRHLFFPGNLSLQVKNVFKKFGILRIKKKVIRNITLFKLLRQRKTFLLKSGKALLSKIFISSKWSYGFVSNSSSFFSFTDNVQHEKVKFGKIIQTFEEKVESFMDLYPYLPHYGLIGDHKSNYWIVNEFKMAKVPNTSIIDNFTKNALKSMYGIPGNSCSLDTTFFFLMIAIASYLQGYIKCILKFIIKYFRPAQEKKEDLVRPLLFYKNLRLLDELILKRND